MTQVDYQHPDYDFFSRGSYCRVLAGWACREALLGYNCVVLMHFLQYSLSKEFYIFCNMSTVLSFTVSHISRDVRP